MTGRIGYLAEERKAETSGLQGISEHEVERSLRFGTRDGLFFSLMSGFGEGYLGAFVIFLKASNLQVGFLASIPQLLGALLQLLSVRVLNHLKSRKRLILVGVSLQTLTWVPILLLPLLFPAQGPLLLIISVTFYFIFGNFATPAWNSLMGDLVDPNRRGSYFGRRNQLMSVFVFSSLCLGGLILHVSQRAQIPWVGFAIIFTLACLSRGISAYCLSKLSEPAYGVNKADDFSVWQFLRQGRQSNFARFILYTGLIHLTANVAGPFFAVYMLRDLGFSYLQFMIVSATAVLVQFVTLHYWGRFADRFGNKKVLTLTGIFLPVLPTLWLVSQEFYYLLTIQLLGGFIWAGFILSMGNFVFDTVSPPKRARCVAIYNGGNALGVFIGASLGGWIATWLPVRWELFGWEVGFASNLQWLFLLSGVLRLLVAMSLLRSFREVREVQDFSMRDLFFRVSQIRPISGVRFDLFTGYRSSPTSNGKVPDTEEEKEPHI